MSEDREAYILDTSALFTYIEDEAGADVVEQLLIDAEEGRIRILVSFISLTELFYITAREKGDTVAQERLALLLSLSITIQESEVLVNTEAGRLKNKHRISLADAYIAALCKIHSGILVHKDPEFEQLTTLIKEHRLPYKK
ncbi:MAG: type II toxin-antitoxin system VapC family toxin [Nitrospirota bacterium]|nr:type II toxin-antitoxin system VapC family toxin [Nitrospirota bacterium]